MLRAFISTRLRFAALLLTAPAFLAAQSRMSDADLANARPGRAPRQPIDTQYTRKIKEYTTQPYFLSPIVDYMPASKTVPTPAVTLGNIAGAPGKLPYSKEVYDYMRLLAKATPRVRVFSIGTTEEGREMIAVAIASEQLMAKLDANKADLAKLADPRTINMNDSLADVIAKRAAPVYYITGTIHSTEAGAPTAMMEMAYRLAVDESPYIRNIREHVITLITPIVEVDGRDRIVDLYEYKKKHPNDIVPGAIYWGKYVQHDNNRDAMALTLKLSTNVLDTYLGWNAQVLHDLHESVAFLYDNTIGDGPYNAWLDPILTNEWQLLGWNNVNEMTRWGMPGVFAFGSFDNVFCNTSLNRARWIHEFHFDPDALYLNEWCVTNRIENVLHCREPFRVGQILTGASVKEWVSIDPIRMQKLDGDNHSIQRAYFEEHTQIHALRALLERVRFLPLQ